MKAVAYFRVSTSAQGRSGLGLEAQQSAVATLAENQCLVVLTEFTEIESGKRNDRPVLAKALRYAKVANAILLIAKLDRLSRNAAFLLTLRDSGVRFLAADVPDANDLTIGVLAVVAQAEREATSRRTKEALATIKQKFDKGKTHVSVGSGKEISRLGNPNGAAAFGKFAGDTTNARRALQERRRRRIEDLGPILRELRDHGLQSPSAIANELNRRCIPAPRGGRWFPSSISRYL